MAGISLSLVITILSTLGFGFMTYEGFEALINSLVDTARSNWQGVGGDVMSILDLAGFTDALGYSLSAITTKAAVTATKRFLPK